MILERKIYIVVLHIFELRKLYFIYFKQFYNFHFS